jgi:hypothetical protein
MLPWPLPGSTRLAAFGGASSNAPVVWLSFLQNLRGSSNLIFRSGISSSFLYRPEGTRFFALRAKKPTYRENGKYHAAAGLTAFEHSTA